MAHDHEQFGENRSGARKDQWGNLFHTMNLRPFKVEACKCTDPADHVSLTFSIEMEVITVSQAEGIVLMLQGQEIPSEPRWVPVYKVLNQFN